MHIERKGDVCPLTPQVERFFVEALGGIKLDDIQSPEEMRIDYACMRGLVAIELKTLEGDGSERIGNLTNDLQKRKDWPIFLGSAPMESFIKNMEDPEKVRKKVTERIGRTIITHLKKANEQLAAHEAAYPRTNLTRMMLLVNEDHQIYEPMAVTFIISNELKRQKNGSNRYANIDVVLYLTERHASVIEDLIAFPVVQIEGPAIAACLWKREVVSFITRAWARWNNQPLFFHDEPPAQFDPIHHIPEMAPRHERWRLEYRRKPYMRSMTIAELRDRFDEMIYVNLLAFLNDSPAKPPPEAVALSMECFAHMMVELADRGIPITQLPYSHERLLEAAKRMKATHEVTVWLQRLRSEGKLG